MSVSICLGGGIGGTLGVQEAEESAVAVVVSYTYNFHLSLFFPGCCTSYHFE
jgi:hypothetical protein